MTAGSPSGTAATASLTASSSIMDISLPRSTPAVFVAVSAQLGQFGLKLFDLLPHRFSRSHRHHHLDNPGLSSLTYYTMPPMERTPLLASLRQILKI